MPSSNFAFIPRKLAQTGQNAGDAVKSRKSFNRKPDIPAEHVVSTTSFSRDKKKEGKHLDILDDSAYTTLFVLALSEHALWSNHELLEAMEANEEGFIPISYLIQSSPLFSVLSGIPPETVLIRCVRASSILDGRLIISEPSSSSWMRKSRSYTENEGGFEVRRRDWRSISDRVRKYTSFHWESRTVYVENLPYRARTFCSVYEFIQQLLSNGRSGESDAFLMQSISFPRHQKDRPEAPPPTVGKGFAFIVLSSVKDVDYLLEHWPWELVDGYPEAEESKQSKVIQEAMEHGFRCLQKRKWDELKEQYLALQRQLLEKTMAVGHAGPPVTMSSQVNGDKSKSPQTADRRVSPQGDLAKAAELSYEPPAWYPKDCLVFVKNIHPETNKTTLRTLFSFAFDKDVSHIDYVDYNKGLDSCYLRLSDSQSARTLVSYLSEVKVFQRNALDDEGAHTATTDRSALAIEVDLVQGTKADLYWEKVPENIRKSALAKVKPNARLELSAQGSNFDDDAGRRRKRRKRV
ncbi:hypothetical protein ACEPAI_5695 [Sanghuangporus weigelae]